MSQSIISRVFFKEVSVPQDANQPNKTTSLSQTFGTILERRRVKFPLCSLRSCLGNTTKKQRMFSEGEEKLEEALDITTYVRQSIQLKIVLELLFTKLERKLIDHHQRFALTGRRPRSKKKQKQE